MANTSIDLVGLDFDQIRNNLKTYMKGKPAFSDVDFEGSNISMLIDVLAYNTYLNSFYLNMVASEMFMDSATQRDSVVSHAKELNYLPRSFKSAVANLKIDITPSVGTPASVTIPKYTTFTTKVGSNSYSFSTDSSVVITNPANGVYSANVSVYEGTIVVDTFVKNSNNVANAQRFVLSNPTVDTSSIVLQVVENNGADIFDYVYAESLYNITANSQVFYLQPAENQQYELIFGENYLGRSPREGAAIVATYRACSGELPNGAATFNADTSIDGHSNVVVTTIQSASSGQVNESVESIRLNAPRTFATQQRAVTATDYETLLKANFSEITAISVYGGEDATPPVYGKVFCAVDIKNADGVPENKKRDYVAFLKNKTPLAIDVAIVDPEFIYYSLTSDITYNLNITSKMPSEIETAVRGAIQTYNAQEVEGFNKTLRYSRLIRQMDDADASIISNRTTIKIIKMISPLPGEGFNTVFNFGQALQKENDVTITTQSQETAGSRYGRTLMSTPFFANGKQSIIVDDSLGRLYIAEFVTVEAGEQNMSQEYTVGQPVGYVNYETGEVKLESLIVDSYTGAFIKMLAVPKSVDVKSSKNSILTIDFALTTITASGVTI